MSSLLTEALSLYNLAAVGIFGIVLSAAFCASVAPLLSSLFEESAVLPQPAKVPTNNKPTSKLVKIFFFIIFSSYTIMIFFYPIEVTLSCQSFEATVLKQLIK